MTARWIEIAVGVLLLISPWVLGFSNISIAKWVDLVFGIIIILVNVQKVAGKTDT
jgi:hypothetical protein